MSLSEDRVRLEAFGSAARVAVTDPARLADAVDVVRETIDEFDRACSRFRSDSELSAVNAAAGAPVRVGPVLMGAVSAALRAARLTGGDVDPTVGRALIALGYDRDFDELRVAADGPGVGVAADGPGVRVAADGPGVRGVAGSRVIGTVAGWRTVVVDEEAGTIRVPAGVMLDLGATAKALAADRAAGGAGEAAGCGVLVSFGGDLAIVGPAPEDGWRIRVTDDHRAGVDAPGQWISLRSGGLATSSTTVRRWRTGVGRAHHLVDPSTGESVDSVWRTVSVTAASCLDANIAATTAIIRGEPAQAWLEAVGLPSRLVRTDGTVRHVAGWPSKGDDLPVGDSVAVGGVGDSVAGGGVGDSRAGGGVGNSRAGGGVGNSRAGGGVGDSRPGGGVGDPWAGGGPAREERRRP
jgi:FAD:protein FMN transferase